MTQRTILATFENETDLVEAAEAARHAGWRIVDIYSPYPLHEAAHLLGLPRSRLPRAAFVFGLFGLAVALGFQFWSTASNWPLNVGGRPWNSLPAFVPVAFEMMILFAGLGVVLTWLVVCRLFPGKTPDLPIPKVTDDLFVLEVCSAEAPANSEGIRKLFQEHHTCAVDERER